MIYHQIKILFALKTLDPECIGRFTGHSEARFANEIDLRLYDDKELLAEVIPEGGRELTRVIGGFGLLDWRLSRNGLVYLSRHKESRVSLSLPLAEAIVTKWMESRKWRVELSTAGRIAKQMIRQLGGKGGTGILARKAIIELLDEINSSHEKYMLAGTLWQRTKEIAKQIVPEIANLTKREERGRIKENPRQYHPAIYWKQDYPD